MIFYFADKDMNVEGIGSSSLPGTNRVSNYKIVKELDGGVATLQFEYNGNVNTVRPGNYVLTSIDGEDSLFTIIDSDESLGTVQIYAENAGLELINSVYASEHNTIAMPAALYVERFIANSGFELGINEVAGRSRTLSWEGDGTGLERLKSVANGFDAELRFRVEFNGIGIAHKYVDLLESVGKDDGRQLRTGYEILQIDTEKDIKELATSLKPIGGMPEDADEAISIIDAPPYDDGDIFKEGEFLYSREAIKAWSRYEDGTNKGIVKSYSYDTLDPIVLQSKAISKLKKVRIMKTTYDINVAPSVRDIGLGDVVTVVNSKNKTSFRARVTAKTYEPNEMGYKLEALENT